MMKQLENHTGSAPKIGGGGNLEYALWVDEYGVLFIQILKNVIETTKPGTHTKLLLRASDYLDERYDTGDYASIWGINPATLQNEEETDNNNSGFIKAILRHLFPKGLRQ